MKEIQDLINCLNVQKNIVITSHRNPDGDAIGSCLALKSVLDAHLHVVNVVVPSDFPDDLSWLHGSGEIYVYDREQDKSLELIKSAEVIFCLDYNSLERVDKIGEAIRVSDATKVMIDHHLYPDGFADVLISEPEISSTCELLYEVFKGAGWLSAITIHGLEALLVGMITDTGSFKYSISPNTFKNAGEIISQGGDIAHVQDMLYNHMPEKSLRLLGHCLSNRMNIYPDRKAGLIYLSKKDYMDFNIQRGDTEGIVTYLLRIDIVNVDVFISEQPSIVKVSLRSKGDFSVEKMAKEYFRGGGHKNASGGALYSSLKTVISTFEEATEKYKTEIINSY
ncbi:MAG: DHH family phosphoesterase [Saprospiraceae bacterium]